MRAALTNEQLLDKIRQLFRQQVTIQEQARKCENRKKRLQIVKRWYTLSDSVEKRLQQAKYFRSHAGLCLKVLTAHYVEVASLSTGLLVAPLNGEWIDLIAAGPIISQAEYLAHVELILTQQASDV